MKTVKLFLRTILTLFLIFALYSAIDCVVDVFNRDESNGGALAMVVVIIFALMPILFGDIVALIIVSVSLSVHIKKYREQRVKKYELVWLSLLLIMAISVIAIIVVSVFLT